MVICLYGLFINVCKKKTTYMLNTSAKARTINIMCLFSVSRPLVISSHLCEMGVYVCVHFYHIHTSHSGVVSTIIRFSHKTAFNIIVHATGVLFCCCNSRVLDDINTFQPKLTEKYTNNKRIHFIESSIILYHTGSI